MVEHDVGVDAMSTERTPVDTRRTRYGHYADDGTFVNAYHRHATVSRERHDEHLASGDRLMRDQAARRVAEAASKALIDRALDVSEEHFSALSEAGPQDCRAQALDVLNGLRALRGRPPLPSVPDPELTALAEPTRLLAGLRRAGWAVGVHNDYRLNGRDHTFWLMTHADGTFLKGEGTTDLEALGQLARQVDERAASPIRYGEDEE